MAPIRNKNILVIGDNQMKDAAEIIKSTLRDSTYNVFNICRPDAGIKDISNDIDNLAKDFSPDDCVIIEAGSRDVLSGRKLDLECISKILRKLAHTQVLFVSIPFYNCPVICYSIYEHNHELNRFVQKSGYSNAGFLEINELFDEDDCNADGFHFTQKSRNIIFEHIARIIGSFNKRMEGDPRSGQNMMSLLDGNSMFE